MSDQIDPKELLGKVEDNTLRNQLGKLFDDLSGSALRQQVDTLKDENKTLKGTLRSKAFQDAGFDPESGPGKALAKLYEGEPDPEKIREVASEYGLSPANGGQAPAPDPNAQRQAGEDRTALLNQGSTAPRDPSVEDQIAAAEKNGDWEAYDRLQASKLLA